MNPVIQILMERDGLTQQEAEQAIEETVDIMLQDPWNADEIMLNELGLEPDYLMDMF